MLCVFLHINRLTCPDICRYKDKQQTDRVDEMLSEKNKSKIKLPKPKTNKQKKPKPKTKQKTQQTQPPPCEWYHNKIPVLPVVGMLMSLSVM